MKKDRFSENSERSLVKTVSYRLLIVVADLVVIYAITRRADFTVSITVFSNLASTLLYFLHERLWNRVGWGKKART